MKWYQKSVLILILLIAFLSISGMSSCDASTSSTSSTTSTTIKAVSGPLAVEFYDALSTMAVPTTNPSSTSMTPNFRGPSSGASSRPTPVGACALSSFPTTRPISCLASRCASSETASDDRETAQTTRSRRT